ncbi:hypothetical protein BC938DRAFT_476602 [Jimgerdemannia flammicorona]|uniref:Phospholipid/glycerol acyltransferase domain-containing protein n=1 Tax=Jimgerdemannia flammicorona TaxID=994334 RepID=A0A433QQB7_9FUNG|nr:hypothetical protein BC938DRAFT_476602 [Jimgerdemannia flammicorona]
MTLMRECRHRVSFLITEKSMHQWGIGFFTKMIHTSAYFVFLFCESVVLMVLGGKKIQNIGEIRLTMVYINLSRPLILTPLPHSYAVPVVHPQDLAKPGVGMIQLLNIKTDPLHITGLNMCFTTQLHVGDSISLPKGLGSAEVTQIVSDTELLIKKEFKELRAIELLTSEEGCPFKCLPHVDQESIYRSVHKTLNEGNCIAIFPEGGSRDRAEMLPLKAGFTVMALCMRIQGSM